MCLGSSTQPCRRLWNYNPDNDDHKGDDWNGENFSWVSRRRALHGVWLDLEQASPTLDNGARILRAIVRPYPAKTAGIPLNFDYEMNTGQFTYEWMTPGSPSNKNSSADTGASTISVKNPPSMGHPPLTSKKTEIFVPSMLVHGRKLVVHGLREKDRYKYEEAQQTLSIITGDLVPGEIRRITVSVEPPLKAAFEVNSFLDDFGGHIAAIVVLVLSFLVYLAMQ